ncbi:MAG: hypothetical protein LBB13_02845 [Rickettsiales bacterium]|jgi:tRNA A37 threonylcarbamoyladenosine modification protein TsaB|nr:hypothetical protein [Rickettsiales bacterium]
MIILTIDTTGEHIFGVLQRNDEVIDEISSNRSNRHAEYLLTLMKDFLSRNDLSYKSVDCFSAISGPGSFIGLKVSIAFIKAVVCVLFDRKIILNSIFQILSFCREYDFVVLEANATNLYVNDSEQNNFYWDRKNFFDSLDGEKRIITNSHNVMDFLKTSNSVFRQVDARGIAALNYFRYTRGQFDVGEIKPTYIRELQVNTKHG